MFLFELVLYSCLNSRMEECSEQVLTEPVSHETCIEKRRFVEIQLARKNIFSAYAECEPVSDIKPAKLLL